MFWLSRNSGSETMVLRNIDQSIRAYRRGLSSLAIFLVIAILISGIGTPTYVVLNHIIVRDSSGRHVYSYGLNNSIGNISIDDIYYEYLDKIISINGTQIQGDLYRIWILEIDRMNITISISNNTTSTFFAIAIRYLVFEVNKAQNTSELIIVSSIVSGNLNSSRHEYMSIFLYYSNTTIPIKEWIGDLIIINTTYDLLSHYAIVITELGYLSKIYEENASRLAYAYKRIENILLDLVDKLIGLDNKYKLNLTSITIDGSIALIADPDLMMPAFARLIDAPGAGCMSDEETCKRLAEEQKDETYQAYAGVIYGGSSKEQDKEQDQESKIGEKKIIELPYEVRVFLASLIIACVDILSAATPGILTSLIITFAVMLLIMFIIEAYDVLTSIFEANALEDKLSIGSITDAIAHFLKAIKKIFGRIAREINENLFEIIRHENIKTIEKLMKVIKSKISNVLKVLASSFKSLKKFCELIKQAIKWLTRKEAWIGSLEKFKTVLKNLVKWKVTVFILALIIIDAITYLAEYTGLKGTITINIWIFTIKFNAWNTIRWAIKTLAAIILRSKFALELLKILFSGLGLVTLGFTIVTTTLFGFIGYVAYKIVTYAIEHSDTAIYDVVSYVFSDILQNPQEVFMTIVESILPIPVDL